MGVFEKRFRQNLVIDYLLLTIVCMAVFPFAFLLLTFSVLSVLSVAEKSPFFLDFT